VYLVPFSLYSKLIVISRSFKLLLPHMYLPFPLGITQLEFKTSGISKLECLGYHVVLSAVMTRIAIMIEHQLVMDRQTDRQT